MTRVLVCVAALALLGALSGCSRKATLMQETHDSTATVANDSTAALLNQVQQAWDNPATDNASASLTLRALSQDLARHQPAEWSGRAEELLDSLGVGVETAGGPAALFVNVFVRADPTRGSWPGLYWHDGATTRYQEIEGRSMRLIAAASGRADSAGGSPTRVAALFTRARGSRQEPMLYAWERRPKEARWHIGQTLGPDSLGGYGTGTFEAQGDSVDLVASTYTTPKGFDECATCPHATRQHRFRWRPDGFARIADHDVPSTYATFVHFIAALRDDPAAAAALAANPALVDDANKLEWNHSKGTWRIAPATEEGGNELTFFRGGQEAYRVEFQPRGQDWVISAIQSVSRSVE